MLLKKCCLLATTLCGAIGLATFADDGKYSTFPEGEQKPVAGNLNFPKAELRKELGRGMVYVDGKPLHRIAASSSSSDFQSLSDKIECGTEMVQSRDIAIGGGEFQEESRRELDWTMKKILDAIPDAKVVLRANIQPTREFLDSHPESWVTGANGETVFQDRFNLYFYDVPKNRPSWASLEWRKYVDTTLRNLIQYISEQAYAKNIIGFDLAAGHTGEYDQWFGGEGWPGGLGGDYCPESLARFRQWLREKYGNDTDRLRESWNDKNVTFDNAQIPKDFGKRRETDVYTSFRNPEGNHQLFDYTEFYRAQIPETIESWSRSIKLASGNRLLTGAMLAAGDSGTRLFNTSPWIDFGSGPGTYFYREPGNHRRLDFIGEDLRRHGKWFLEEMDIRTKFYGAQEYKVETIDKTLSVLAREYAQITTEGVGGYWYEFRSITYCHPAIWRLFRKQAEISELAARHDIDQPGTDVLVVFGDEGATVSNHDSDLRTNILSRIGTPYHAMYLETLTEQDPATLPYKVYLFITAAQLNSKQRDFIDKNLKKNGNWLVFFRPCGAYWPDGDEKFSLANSSKFIGIRLDKNPENPKKMKSEEIEYVKDNPLPDVSPGEPIGNADDMVKGKSRPTAWTVVSDPEAKPIADWKDGTVAAALKKQGDWTSVYCPTLAISPQFIRSVIKASGAHQYLDNGDDVIYAGANLLNIHSRTEGVRNITLRKESDLYDLHNDCFIGKGQKSYQIEMGALENRLFFLGDPREELKKIREEMDDEILARRFAAQKQARKKLEEMTTCPSEGPYHLLNNGKITRYLFLGPVELPENKTNDWAAFENKALSENYIEGGESALKPAPFKKQTITGSKEQSAWRPLYTGAPRFYSGDFYEEPNRNLIFYVATYIESPKGGKYNLHLDTERGQNLYLDGKKIGESYYSGEKQFDFPIELSPGKRHLLIFKIFSAGGGNSGWWAKLTDSEGKAAKDLNVYLEGN